MSWHGTRVEISSKLLVLGYKIPGFLGTGIDRRQILIPTKLIRTRIKKTTFGVKPARNHPVTLWVTFPGKY